MKKRGRKSTLTEKQQREIAEQYRDSDKSAEEIGNEHGISKQRVKYYYTKLQKGELNAESHN